MKPAFTLIEILVSVSIIAILSVGAVWMLQGSLQDTDLANAARLVVSDFRAIQTRALTAQSVNTCLRCSVNVTCEIDTKSCCCGTGCSGAGPWSACTAKPALTYGLHFATAGIVTKTDYEALAEVAPSRQDDRSVGIQERIYLRDLLDTSRGNVLFDRFILSDREVNSLHVFFDRQNGKMHINCNSAGICSEEPWATLRLRHKISGKTVNVTISAVTGRISIE